MMTDNFVDAGDAMSWLFALYEDTCEDPNATVARGSKKFRVLREGERFEADDMDNTSERVRHLWDGAWHMLEGDSVAAVLQLVDHSVRALCVLAAHDLDMKPRNVHLDGVEPAATYQPVNNRARQLLEAALRECQRRHAAAHSPRYTLLTALYEATQRKIKSECMKTLHERVRTSLFKNKPPPPGAVELIVDELRATTSYKHALHCSFYFSGTPFNFGNDGHLLPQSYGQYRPLQRQLPVSECTAATKTAFDVKDGFVCTDTLHEKLHNMTKKLRAAARTGISTPDCASAALSAMRVVLRAQHVLQRFHHDESDDAQHEFDRMVDSLNAIVDRFNAANAMLKKSGASGKRKRATE